MVEEQPNPVPVDEALARAQFVQRAALVRWRQAPQWAWKYIVEETFGVVRAYWADESEEEKLRTDPVFDVVKGERVVIPLDWR